MGHEEDRATEGAEEAHEVCGEVCRACHYYAQSERDQREIGRDRVVDVEKDPVGKDGQKWGQPLNSVYKGDWNARHGVGAENMPTDLEEG